MAERSQDQESIDGASILKHAKKLYSEREYRQRYCRLDYYKPTPKQIETHNAVGRYKCARAGNRSGKTVMAGAESSMHLLRRYPSWFNTACRYYEPPAIARNVTFNAWVIAPDTVTLRDVQQAQLIGGLDQDSLGTGWLPLSALGNRIIVSHGTGGLADRVPVRRDDGTLAFISSKTHMMDRTAFQGAAVDWVWLDEDIRGREKNAEVWNELIARGVGVGGRILMTATFLEGVTPIREFFRDGGQDRIEVRMSLYDNTYLSREDIETAERTYSERERACRLYGDDLPGHGSVINYHESVYLHDKQPEDFPEHWGWINGLDFNHFGQSAQAHPLGWVCCCVDPTTDTVYVMHTARIRGGLARDHVKKFQEWAGWDAPCAWPGSDGHQRTATGRTYKEEYAALGMPMMAEHASLANGDLSVEGQVHELNRMIGEGRLKIARHLTEMRTEMRDWSYDANNKIIALNEDLCSALRYAVAMRRKAKPLLAERSSQIMGWDPARPFRNRRGDTEQARLARLARNDEAFAKWFDGVD